VEGESYALLEELSQHEHVARGLVHDDLTGYTGGLPPRELVDPTFK